MAGATADRGAIDRAGEKPCEAATMRAVTMRTFRCPRADANAVAGAMAMSPGLPVPADATVPMRCDA